MFILRGYHDRSFRNILFKLARKDVLKLGNYVIYVIFIEASYFDL